MAKKPVKSNAARKSKGRKRPGDDKQERGSGKRDPNRPDGSLPSRDRLLQFIAQADGKVGKREIARAFGLKGGARIALKRVLADLADEGILAGSAKDIRRKGALPPVAVLEVFDADTHGDLLARPTVWNDDDGPRPSVRMSIDESRPDRERSAKFGIGDRVLARISPLPGDDPEGNNEADSIRFSGEAIRKLSRETRTLLGIYRAHFDKPGGVIEPVDRKNLREYQVQKSDVANASDGDLVRFELVREGRRHIDRAQIREVLGNPNDQRQISLIAIHAHGLPDTFPQSVLGELDDLPAIDQKSRTDLTGMPLVTIDPPDARDHDDAVHAERDEDKTNPGGFIVTVAIADVAHYVRPGSKLDREAFRRGNSVYFPDRVVPMLPERISNDLCSLREDEIRPCLAVRMIYDRDGAKRGHTFLRALMRSHKKLSYAQAQQVFDGEGEAAEFDDVAETALKPLWEAYETLRAAREKRAPLDLDLPERKLRLDDQGRVADVYVPERLDAHKLIEEFMIQANVAAAEELEKYKAPVMYRTHDKPAKEKLKALRDFLETLDLKLPTDSSLRPKAFNAILEKAKSLPVPELVNEVVLRSQSQAEYTPDNIGHFGLNLHRYAHFTSPIRRYADLMVHRALITALGFGHDGLVLDASADGVAETKLSMSRIATAISEAERRAMAAERETIDRLIAAHLADRIGAQFKAKVAGVTRSGLFVRLAESGADGFIPISTLGDEYFVHVEEAHALIGQRSGLGYAMGDAVEVKLVEAVPAAGALRFEMLSEPQQPRGSGMTIPKGLKRPSSGPRGRMSGGKPGGGKRGQPRRRKS